MSDQHDEICNFSSNEHFQDVLARGAHAGISRRNLIRGGVGLAALSTVPFLSACGGGDDVPVEKALSFGAVGKSIADSVMLPAGYTFSVLHATGDRLVSGIPAYSNQGTEADDWSQRVGDHHDGVEFFYIGTNGRYSATETTRAVLAMNHESSADAHFFHPKGQTSNGDRKSVV